MELAEFKDSIRRKAIRMQIGGFRPSGDPMSSQFGAVTRCSSSEEWPSHNEKPMHALCQINLSELPFKPEGLEDVAFLTVFISQENYPDDSPNGSDWCLRSYRSLDDLVELQKVNTGSAIKVFEMKPEVIEEDYPCHDDVEDVPEEIEAEYYDLFENQDGLKLGGWPTLIQSEIFWAPWNKHPINPRYVFQIDSTEKGNWNWGDGGVGYFGRGTTEEGKDDWAVSWQCY